MKILTQNQKMHNATHLHLTMIRRHTKAATASQPISTKLCKPAPGNRLQQISHLEQPKKFHVRTTTSPILDRMVKIIRFLVIKVVIFVCLDSDSHDSKSTEDPLEATSNIEFSSPAPCPPSKETILIELVSSPTSESESDSIISDDQQRIEKTIKQMSEVERKALHVVSSQQLILDLLDLEEGDDSDDSESCCQKKCDFCLESKAVSCCPSKAKSCCTQVTVSKSFRKAAKVGAKYALAIIEPPAKLTTLFLRLLEIGFFALSIYVYVDEASEDNFIQKLQKSKFSLVLFCLATIDLALGLTLSFISTFLAARKSIQLTSYSKLGEEENPNPRDAQKSGWRAVYELFSKVVVFLLIYPLLIGDIYEFALVWNANNASLAIGGLANAANLSSASRNDSHFVAVLRCSALENVPKSVALVIGLFLTLFDIYLHRIHMMRENFNRIQKVQRRTESCCCSIISRLIAHSVFLMLFNILLLVAIGFKAVEDNDLTCYSNKSCKSNGEFGIVVQNGACNYTRIGETQNGDPTVSNEAWFMIAAGFTLPLLSIAIFIGTNVLWFQEYFVLIFRGVMSKDDADEFEKLPLGLYNYGSKVKERKLKRRVADMLDDRQYSSEFSCWNRFVKSFCDLRAILLVLVYWCSVFAFLAFTFEMGDSDSHEPVVQTSKFVAVVLGLLILFLELINNIITLVLAVSWTCLVFGFCLYCLFCNNKEKK